MSGMMASGLVCWLVGFVDFVSGAWLVCFDLIVW